MSIMHYFAYGSNLHPLRLRERVPSARLIGMVTLEGYRLAFHKKSVDGSGKCNLCVSRRWNGRVHGALYAIQAIHKEALDRAEYRGAGYRETDIRVPHESSVYGCFTYQAQSTHVDESLLPYEWYKALVVMGAEYLAMPEAYVHMLRDVKSMQDPDLERHRKHVALVERLNDANRATRANAQR